MEDKLREIYMQHYTLVMKVIYNVLHDSGACEDVASDVFIKLIERMVIKDDIENVKAWLCITAKHAVYDYIKKNEKFEMPIDVLANTLKSPDFTEGVHKKVYARSILDDLREKNEKWCDMYLMRYLLGFSITEISDFYKCSEAAVSNDLYRAKKYLKSRNLYSDTFLFIFVLMFIYQY